MPDHRYCRSGDQYGIRYGARRLTSLSNVYPDIRSNNKRVPNFDLLSIKLGPNRVLLTFSVDSPNLSLATEDEGFLIRQ